VIFATNVTTLHQLNRIQGIEESRWSNKDVSRKDIGNWFENTTESISGDFVQNKIKSFAT